MMHGAIEGTVARSLDREKKWHLLSPFLRQFGRESLAYATLQQGLEYFVDECGYLAYTSVRHRVFAPKGKCIVLSDPVCAPRDYPRIIKRFLQQHPRVAFAVISEECAATLRQLGFKANCVGYESELSIPKYNTQGNWKELDLIKRARNEAKREGTVIREETTESIRNHDLAAVSAGWLKHKKVNDREIWIYARRPVFDDEPDVRKFLAYDRTGRVVGFVFYDPMYRDGQIYGYAANIARCDEDRFGKLATAVHMEAVERFRAEGKEVLNLMLTPFGKLGLGRFNDDWATRLFFQLSERFGNDIYNFAGLAFHKSKYRGEERPRYFASNSLMPSNDVYLAFLSADIAKSYFVTLRKLLWGMIGAALGRRTDRGFTPKGK